MIPDLININNIWEVLPPGIHDATLIEVENRFATNSVRRHLFDGFKRGVMVLTRAGCKTIYLDGSFVTAKESPRDFDACWDPTGVDPGKLDPIFLDFSNGRKNQKQKYFGEFFPSGAIADRHKSFVNFFQVDRHSGGKKGIIRLQI